MIYFTWNLLQLGTRSRPPIGLYKLPWHRRFHEQEQHPLRSHSFWIVQPHNYQLYSSSLPFYYATITGDVVSAGCIPGMHNTPCTFYLFIMCAFWRKHSNEFCGQLNQVIFELCDHFCKPTLYAGLNSNAELTRLLPFYHSRQETDARMPTTIRGYRAISVSKFHHTNSDAKGTAFIVLPQLIVRLDIADVWSVWSFHNSTFHLV